MSSQAEHTLDEKGSLGPAEHPRSNLEQQLLCQVSGNQHNVDEAGTLLGTRESPDPDAEDRVYCRTVWNSEGAHIVRLAFSCRAESESAAMVHGEQCQSRFTACPLGTTSGERMRVVSVQNLTCRQSLKNLNAQLPLRFSTCLASPTRSFSRCSTGCLKPPRRTSDA